jgi:hypothetical protein
MREDSTLLVSFTRIRGLGVRQKELELITEGPLDVEATTCDALAYLARLREVLEEGTLE